MITVFIPLSIYTHTDVCIYICVCKGTSQKSPLDSVKYSWQIPQCFSAGSECVCVCVWVWGGYHLWLIFSIDFLTMGPFHLGCGSGKLITKVNNIIFHLLTTQCVLFSKNIILQCLGNFPSGCFLPRHPEEELWEGFRSKPLSTIYWDEYIYCISEKQLNELFYFRNSHLYLQYYQRQQIDLKILF